MRYISSIMLVFAILSGVGLSFSDTGIKGSNLPAATSVAGGDETIIIQSGTTKRAATRLINNTRFSNLSTNTLNYNRITNKPSVVTQAHFTNYSANRAADGGVAGVSSFNSRSGAVTPQLSDYSAFYKDKAGFSSYSAVRQVEINSKLSVNAFAPYTTANRRSSTLVIASSTTSGPVKADYYATGTNDQVVIKAAIDRLVAANLGGKIVFTEGSYNISSAMDYTNTQVHGIEFVGTFGGGNPSHSGAWANTGTQFVLTGNVSAFIFGTRSQNLAFRNLTFKAAASSQPVLKFLDTAGVPCNNITFDNVHWDRPHIAIHAESPWDWWLHNCTFFGFTSAQTNNPVAMIQISDSPNVTAMSGFKIDGARYDMMPAPFIKFIYPNNNLPHPSGYPVRHENLTIQGSKFEAAVTGDGALNVVEGSVDRLIFAGNDVANSTAGSAVINIPAGDGSTITANTFQGFTVPIYSTGGNANIFTANTIRGGSGAPAAMVVITGGANNIVRGNTTYDTGSIPMLSDSGTATIVDSRDVPTGGTTGQALVKNSNTNYDFGWATVSGGSGSPGGSYSAGPPAVGDIQTNQNGSFAGGPKWDFTNNRMGVGTSTPANKLTIVDTLTPMFILRETTGTNLAYNGFTLQSKTTSTAQRGFGAAFTFQYSDSGVTNQNLGTISAEWESATRGSIYLKPSGDSVLIAGSNNNVGVGDFSQFGVNRLPAEKVEALGNIKATNGQLISTVSTGTSPLVVSSTTEVANLRAATATALASNGANCAAGQAPLGVDANGAVEGCFVPTVAASGISGAVQFSNGSGLDSDAATLFFDNANNRLGIGTGSPANPLHVYGSGIQGFFERTGADGSAGSYYTSIGVRATTTNAAADGRGAAIAFSLSQNSVATTLGSVGASYQGGNGDLLLLPAIAGTPTEKFRVRSTGVINVATSTSPAGGDQCTAGDITWDGSYVYVCVATGTNGWRRAALSDY